MFVQKKNSGYKIY